MQQMYVFLIVMYLTYAYDFRLNAFMVVRSTIHSEEGNVEVRTWTGTMQTV